MFKKKYDLAIINRSFWPENEMLGEAKLKLAEFFSGSKKKVCVITQSNADIERELEKAKRGNNVSFFYSKSYSNSSSSVSRRVLDTLLFAPFVFFSLIRGRPRHVYVSTNPPILIPLLVCLYAKTFRASFTYHVQDVHPEITDLVNPMNKLSFYLLRWLDNITLRNASRIITLSDEMVEYLKKTSNTGRPINIIDNPAFDLPRDIKGIKKSKNFVFCGNAGRVQQIPVLLNAIKAYLNNGGKLNFTFIGKGVYSPEIESLSKEYERVTYHGYLKPSSANNLVAEHQWAILPILDEVTRFAFPSKSSSYAASGCRVMAICGNKTSVSKWVEESGFGIQVNPVVKDLVDTFFQIENGFISSVSSPVKPDGFSKNRFALKLKEVIEPSIN
ncbi:MAG: glycosyltransferase [Idiomarinaceae bacterium]|uniref:glycosyltransferase n=1 Tax=Idiomarina sp. 28-8 TaxID=1260624 RepID=UPI0002DB8236|nr:glycosyltransferase [Idiomarina sp. 28-8]NWO01548.1 glycosyltransferase [Idiomarinaceae bacterium]